MGVYFDVHSGTPQSALVGSPFALPLEVLVLDDVMFLPLPGVTVTFSVVVSGVSLDHPTAVSGIDGIASVNATAGLVYAVATVQASVAGATHGLDVFTLTATTHYVTITQPPILIDPTYFSMNYQGFSIVGGIFPTLTMGSPMDTFAGPYEYGGKLYYVGYASLQMPHPNPDGGGAPPLYTSIGYGPFIVLQSGDGGATWSLQDVANHPRYFLSYPAIPPFGPYDFTEPPIPILWRFVGNRVYYNLKLDGIFIALSGGFSSWGYFDFDLDAYSSPVLGLVEPVLPSPPAVYQGFEISLWPYHLSAGLLPDRQIGGNLDTLQYFSFPFAPNPDFGKGRLIFQYPGGGVADITPAYFSAWGHTKFEVAVSEVDPSQKLHHDFSHAGGADAHNAVLLHAAGCW